MRYIIGIDLGTTNSSLAYVDTQKPPFLLQLFSIPQLVSAGRIGHLFTLPSFCYLIDPHEWSEGTLKLPWKEEQSTFVGQFAKTQGARVPTRSIQSAKSWLCNAAANRRDKILPLEAANSSQRLSPVEVSAKYLLHLKEAWDATMAKGDPSAEFEDQEIILTVPASFDEVARTLTIEAARLAGFKHVTLLEEPQAAFYSWIAQHEQEWHNQLKDGDAILVCDVGGGTTDFSLIEVQEKEGKLTFQRMAVGNHLLLGGDNMDAALAHYLEKKMQEQGLPTLESTQWLQLKAEARSAKEDLFDPRSSHQTHTIVLQGTGSSVIKGSLSVTVERKEMEELLLKGFFGQYPLSEALQMRRSRGFRTMGLPYEDEPSITKQMAHFLQQAGYFERNQAVSHVLFNGGAMKPSPFQQSIQQSLQNWFPNQPIQVLSSFSLDLAVARGAAYYGKVKRGLGVAIGGGLPRSYYLELDVKDVAGHVHSRALTLLPRGSEEETSYQPDQTFFLRPNTPVSFHLLTSHVRLHDHQGDLLPIDELEMQRLPPIQTILRFGRKQGQEQEAIPVKLGIKLTAIGTIEIWLESQKTDHRWNLEFQLRTATGQDSHLATVEQNKQDETFDLAYMKEAQQAIDNLFSDSSPIKPGAIMEKLEELLEKDRREWSSSVLRGLWDPLIKKATHRKISVAHEIRWWNLAGFLLRPGYGFPLDDFRIKDLWKIILSDLRAVRPLDCQIQQWICFRRIAGGLNKGQQMQIASELVSTLFSKKSGKIEIKSKSELYSYSEKIRALAALERIDIPLKTRLGEAVLDRIIKQEALESDYWALGRIGARHLVYGSIAHVVPRDIVSKWIGKLLKANHPNKESLYFVLGLLARRTDYRELNLPDSLIDQIHEQYPNDHLQKVINHEERLTPSEEEQLLGDRLPAGLILELSGSLDV